MVVRRRGSKMDDVATNFHSEVGARTSHDIPNGYCETKHQALARTIADPGAAPVPGAPLRAMACHETDDAHCVGWVNHQLGPGNNILLRLHIRDCSNIDKLRLRGEQHQSFEATLPGKPVESS